MSAVTPSFDEILHVALQTVVIFGSYGLNTCLFGSAACRLYGTTRPPNDVDIVVLTDKPEHQDNKGGEALKQLLVKADKAFYLVKSKRPGADYQVLWYRLPGLTAKGHKRRCKVDILVPGVMNIPNILTRQIEVRHNVPVMPLLPLLLLKLQGWTGHRDSDELRKRLKQPVDVQDLRELLQIATRRVDLDIHHPGQRWVPKDFVDAAQERVYQITEAFPDTAFYWAHVGFYVR